MCATVNAKYLKLKVKQTLVHEHLYSFMQAPWKTRQYFVLFSLNNEKIKHKDMCVYYCWGFPFFLICEMCVCVFFSFASLSIHYFHFFSALLYSLPRFYPRLSLCARLFIPQNAQERNCNEQKKKQRKQTLFLGTVQKQNVPGNLANG